MAGPRSRIACSFAVGLALGAASCGPSGPDDWPPTRPRIDTLEFLSRVPGDGIRLAFRIEWFDSDGDLGMGGLDLFVEGQQTERFELNRIFAAQRPETPLDALTGSFEIVVVLDSEDVARGDQIELGFEVEDARGQRSNRPTTVFLAT